MKFNYETVPAQYKIILETDNQWSFVKILDIKCDTNVELTRGEDGGTLSWYNKNNGYHKTISIIPGVNGNYVQKRNMYIKDLDKFIEWGSKELHC